MKQIVVYCKSFFKTYSFLVVGFILWLLGGFTLGIVGCLTTFFVKTLIHRLKADASLEETIENPFKKSGTTGEMESTPDEPFDGAMLVAALGVYCTGNADFAGMQMQKRFSLYYVADWTSLCRIASRCESLNGDLIVECLGATLLKKPLHDTQYEKLLWSIFTFLSVVEYDWNSERGIKPSEYLADLLQNPMYLNETGDAKLEQAYLLLGISPDASIEVVKSAHRSLVALYHPDTVGDLSESQKKIAAEAFLRIQAAYESILETF